MCSFWLFFACFSKILFFLQGEWDFKKKAKTKKKQFLTYKKTKFGPVFNSTAYYIYIYIYADESGKGTHFDKWQVKQRDAKISFVDRKNVENVALPP